MVPVSAVPFPQNSVLRSWLPDADFHDSYSAPLTDPTLSPIEIFLRASRATPEWVSTLMSIRNRIGIWFGIRDVGGLNPGDLKSPGDYKPGDRLGIFNIFSISESELLLGIDDSHLDVRVSVVKWLAPGAPRYVVSTVVRNHNWLGRLYMAPVGRIHPFIVRAMMRRTVA